MKIKVILADDHAVLREGLRVQINQLPDMEVIAEAANGREVIRLARECSPDIIIMDISMPDLNGVEATRTVLSETPGVKVIALSMHAEKRYVSRMLKAGASGYLLKDSVFTEIAAAIRHVAQGRPYLSPQIADIVLEGFVRPQVDKETSPLDLLTSREREVLQLMAESKTTKEIASRLHVSIRTVETHRQSLMDKLGIHDLPGLTKFAIKEGLTSLE